MYCALCFGRCRGGKAQPELQRKIEKGEFFEFGLRISEIEEGWDSIINIKIRHIQIVLTP
jgi:hypothetical protein